MSERYIDGGKNGGTVELFVDGEWVKVVWRNKSDTHETVVAVPITLMQRFVSEMLKAEEELP